MAANFNALPAALMDMKDQNGVIKAQAGVALVMIVIHIFLMYFLAF
ncbi:permease [Streptococcus pneumoniae]|nr:permease [Streptococcus pneumoniae]CJH18373.1 permease [Streptococcus pneumoniae]